MTADELEAMRRLVSGADDLVTSIRWRMDQDVSYAPNIKAIIGDAGRLACVAQDLAAAALKLESGKEAGRG